MRREWTLVPVATAHSESAVAKCHDELSCGDWSSAGRDEAIHNLFGYVIMVKVEAARREPV